ncbi:UPF0406 protein C16orf57-like [Tropilaelaps mercedesae]|uniref:U6 snRNA phosphodiesterase 1 n=1 Tax=Tropilaelaps mercedesae TaxID=418985 RepID=A0A1V9XH80_9ACAR|nr:UPF0406 protein C16orf57-like [Tropilaelaps mercedesae]
MKYAENMSLKQLASTYDSSGHSSSEGSNSSNSAHASMELAPVRLPASPSPAAKRAKLEVPNEIADMFGASGASPKWVDDPSQHGGRQRSFEHEQGVWPSLFYVQTCDSECIEDLQQIAAAGVPFLVPLKASQSHISLSRTLKCRYQWIKPLYTHIRQGVYAHKPFLVSFSRFGVYENDDKKTVFLAVDVDLGHGELVELSKRVNVSLDLFRLPNFYSNPKFHISIGWAPGHCKADLVAALPALQQQLDDYCTSVELAGVVDRLCFRSGHKLFEVPLGFEIPNLAYKTAGVASPATLAK